MSADRHKSGLCLNDCAGDKLFPIDVASDIDTSAANVLYAKSMTLILLISTSALHVVVKRIKAR
jgi:hypothetical protein